MKKFWIQLIVLLAVTFSSLYFFYNQSTLTQVIPSFGPTLPEKRLKINETVINVELADDANSRKVGLSGRDSLATDSGMLFIYPDEQVYKFWMKGMRFPLDFIFIRNGKIIDMLKNIPPPQENQEDSTLPIYQPIEAIDMLLEVNAGFADAQNVKVGDSIYLVQ